MNNQTPFFNKIKSVCHHVITEIDFVTSEKYLVDETGMFRGAAQAILLPSSTSEISKCVQICKDHNIGIVPQSGNTGLSAGAIPLNNPNLVVLSTERMNKIISVDPLNYTMAVQSGVTLNAAQEAAANVDCLFPLALASSGTCQIGGNISTNAGGVNFLRYGGMRDLVLGLEVVLPNGNVWNGMRTLRKDNTGYDLKHLFIGAEGTLGIVTEAVLKLFPMHRDVSTSIIALNDPAMSLPILFECRRQSGDAVTGFELIPRLGFDLELKHGLPIKDPFPDSSPWYLLVEFSSSRLGGLRSAMENALEICLEKGLFQNAVLAESEAQRNEFWSIRENVSEAQKREGGGIKHDISVPLTEIPEFLIRASAEVERAIAGVRILAFGHIGDGNIHFNLVPPENDNTILRRKREEINRLVYDVVDSLGGSISAEHGIGALKRMEMTRYKSSVELMMMKSIKSLIDPNSLMNPNKVLPD